MAEVTLTAGRTFDVLNRDELAATLRNWQTELTRGAKLRRHAIQGTTDVAGALLMGDNNDGPAEGMAWAVTRLTVAPGPTLAASGLSVYANDVASPAGLVIAGLANNMFPGDHGLVLLSGDSLRISGVGITASAQVTVTLGIKELPIAQIWSL
jgi:hypothetical protein